LRGWKRRNRQETGMEHPKKMKQHSILIRPENTKHICGAYAFRGPIQIIGEQAPQLIDFDRLPTC
jgi:hypothetical protein